MSAPFGDPAYKVTTWQIGYLTRQVGVAGPSVLPAMANPPTKMGTAAVKGVSNPPTFVTTPAVVAGTAVAEQLPK